MIKQRSSLIYNTSARHERHECDTSDTSVTIATQVRNDWGTSDTTATRVYTNNTSETRLLHERHASVTRVKNFDYFDIFTPLYLLYGKWKITRRGTISLPLEMPCSHVKMRLKSAPQKLNFLMANAISKTYALDCSCKCPCTFLYSYAY